MGAVIGTIEYMAPEQARGEHVDQRVDIYAFGLILYDMLVGPAARRSRAERRLRASEADGRSRLPPMRSIVPQVPEALDKLVTRCIEPDAAKRFQTAAEMVAALDRLDDNGKLRPIKKVIGLPVRHGRGLALAGAVRGHLVSSRGRRFSTTRSSVVIADLENRTNDPAFDRVLEPMLKTARSRAPDSSPRTTATASGASSAFSLRSSSARSPRASSPSSRGWASSRGHPRAAGARLPNFGQGDAGSDGRRRSRALRAPPPSRDQVLEASTRLMTRVRNGLGDDESESAQMFAMTSLSATSLEVVRHFATALEASSNNKFEEARDSLLEGGRARSEVRHRLPEPGRRLAQPRSDWRRR